MKHIIYLHVMYVVVYVTLLYGQTPYKETLRNQLTCLAGVFTVSTPSKETLQGKLGMFRRNKNCFNGVSSQVPKVFELVLHNLFLVDPSTIFVTVMSMKIISASLSLFSIYWVYFIYSYVLTTLIYFIFGLVLLCCV